MFIVVYMHYVRMYVRVFIISLFVKISYTKYQFITGQNILLNRIALHNNNKLQDSLIRTDSY